MDIPEEAVDAAVDALVASRLGDHKGINGEEFVEAARAALEAAAPHMLAEAWEEGEVAGQDNRDSNRGYNIEHKYNPYRSQA